MIDLSNLPVVDAHCHSYLESPTTMNGNDFARYANILSAPPSFLDGKFKPTGEQLHRSKTRLSTMDLEQPFFRLMTRWLADFFHCKPTLEAVAKARSARENDFDQYVRELFEDASLRGLVMDGGYPALSDEDMKRFPAEVVKVFRLETFINDLLARHDSFNEFYSAYETGIRDAIRKEGFVGLKSIIAYRTGLRVRRVGEKEAKKDFLEAKQGQADVAWFGPRIKALRDFLIVRALELSIDLDIPMQIHTGVGDFDILLDQCDPALLYDLLKDDKLRHASVVLVHSGFPNNQNAAFMASVLPNVFLDFSLTIPFLNPLSHGRLKEILEIAPSSKVMYGSDGFNIPEIFWFSAKVGKKVLEKCFRTFAEEKLFDQDEINQKARQILYENATELYRLNES
jgi:predicted TIM-barrel fold metal-dependent hydrolase